MALTKRGKTWHTHFFVDGQRFRQSLETSDWREAQKKEKELISRASQGKLALGSDLFSKMIFSEASAKNLAERAGHLSPRSIQAEKERLKPLNATFGPIRLNRLTVEMIRSYVASRKASNAANKTVNLELGVLRSVLKRGKLWHLFADEIKPLPVHSEIGRAMTLEEKLALIGAAGKKPEWQNARRAMTLSLNTTMRACEIKGLRWHNVDFFANTLSVTKSKTKAGQRLIPLNAEALEAIRELYRQASAIGPVLPDHFVFTACENDQPDPTKPQKSWRSAWRSLRKAAGLPSLRFHDLRHHAITELAESQASDATIMSIAGHVSREMLEHYSHVRLDLKRSALDGLSMKRQAQSDTIVGYDTNNDTKATYVADEKLEVSDLNGRGERIRTSDPLVPNQVRYQTALRPE